MSDDLEAGRRATRDHIRAVQANMAHVIGNLNDRAENHDQSKLHEPEVSGFWEMQQRTPLSQMEYDSPEYRAALAANRETLQHHYAHNDHHPEHFRLDGIHTMNLLQLLEMLADWKAATERMENGDLEASINKNAERFGYDLRFKLLLLRTAAELGWINA